MSARRGKKGFGPSEEYSKPLFSLEFKSLDVDAVQGVFEGYLSTFGNEDRVGDVVEAGAFKKTLSDALASKAARQGSFLLPILWQHNMAQPIGGFLEMREDSKGLWVRGQLDLSTELGRMAWSGLKMGYLGGLSIGYRVIRDTVDKKGVRHLLEIALVEGSVVTMPANEQATVDSANVKTHSQLRETKHGRMLSASNHSTIQQAISDVLNAMDQLQNLLDANTHEESPEEEEQETPQEEAAKSTSRPKKATSSTSQMDKELEDWLAVRKFEKLLADMKSTIK